jgi:putative ABC transport system ATP-binding protein
MNVRQNILCGLHKEKNRTKREALLHEIIVLMQLHGLEKRLPNQLSGGQQQRVAIARAIAAAPDIILADEPCGNLDSKSGQKVMDILCELNSQGRTIILITHDEAAARAAHSIVRLADGRVVQTVQTV